MFSKTLGRALPTHFPRAKSDIGNGFKSPPPTPRRGGGYPVGASTPIIHVQLDGKTIALPKYTYHGTHLPPDKGFKGLASQDKFPVDLDNQKEVNTVLRHHMIEHIPDDEWSTGRNLVSTTKDKRVATAFALKDPDGVKPRADVGYVYTIDMEKVIQDGGFPVFDLSQRSPYRHEEEVGVLYQVTDECIVQAQKVYPDPDNAMYGIVDPETVPNPESK